MNIIQDSVITPNELDVDGTNFYYHGSPFDDEPRDLLQALRTLFISVLLQLTSPHHTEGAARFILPPCGQKWFGSKNQDGDLCWTWGGRAGRGG